MNSVKGHCRQLPARPPPHLLRWMEEDLYGFLYRPDSDMAGALDRDGLAAMVDLIRARSDAVEQATRQVDERARREREAARQRWGEALPTLYAAQRDVDAYVCHAEETGLTASECFTVAGSFGAYGRRDNPAAAPAPPCGRGYGNRRTPARHLGPVVGLGAVPVDGDPATADVDRVPDLPEVGQQPPVG